MFLVLLSAGCSKQVPDLIRDAGLYHAKGQYSAAIIQLKNALKADPRNHEAHLLIATVYADVGQLPDAEKEVRTAMRLGAAPARTLPVLGRALLEMERYQYVIDEFQVPAASDSAQSAQPVSGIALLRGRAFLGLGKPTEAMAQFNLALPEKPIEAKLGMAQVAVAQGDLDSAERLTEEVLAAAPSSAEAWLTKGNLLRERSKTDAAMAAFVNASKLKPNFPPALLSQAWLHLAAGEFADARARIAGARKFAPASPQVRFAAAVLALRERKYAECFEELQQILRVIPEHMPSTLLSGALFFETDSLEQAQIALLTFLRRYPGNVYARKLLAATLLKKAQPQSAAYVLEPLLARVTDDPQLFGLVAQAYLQAGQIDKARGYLEKAVSLDPKNANLRTRLGLSRFAAGDVERAVADLESAAALNPEDTVPEINLIMFLIARNETDKAMRAVEALEKRQPGKAVTHQLKGAMYLAKQETLNARRSFERALKLEPKFYPAAASLAQMDLRENNPSAGRKRLQAFLAIDGRNLDARLALANLELATGQADEALQTLMRTLGDHPRSLQARLMIAQLHLQAGRPQEAVDAAEKAWRIAPSDQRVLDVFGRAQLAVGDAQGAIDTFLNLTQAAPDSVATLLNLASAYTVSGNFRIAGDVIQRALKLDPRSLDARTSLGVLYLNSRRFVQAAEIGRQIQRDHPKLAHGYALQGDALMGQGQYAAAAKAFEHADAIAPRGILRAKLHHAQSLATGTMAGDERLHAWLKEYPEDTDTRIYLADAYLGAGRRKQAIEQYQAVLGTVPKHARVLNNLAAALDEEGDPRALQYAHDAYQTDPSGRAADTLGWILVRQGRFDEALLMLSKAAATFPDIPAIRYHYAQALFKTGSLREAQRELVAALKSGASFKDAAEARALLSRLTPTPG